MYLWITMVSLLGALVLSGWLAWQAAIETADHAESHRLPGRLAPFPPTADDAEICALLEEEQETKFFADPFDLSTPVPERVLRQNYPDLPVLGEDLSRLAELFELTYLQAPEWRAPSQPRPFEHFWRQAWPSQLAAV